jgi:DNA polymerase III alpha subunit
MSTRYNENQLVEGILRHGPEILSDVVADIPSIEKYLSKLQEEKLNYPIPTDRIDHSVWFMPSEYQHMDIEEFLVNQCPGGNQNRLLSEISEYKRRDLLNLLRQMKYIVDTLRKNNIVWGVGRGSSVSSYVLFLLGVHKIDSVKYNLPIEEFFKEI